MSDSHAAAAPERRPLRPRMPEPVFAWSLWPRQPSMMAAALIGMLPVKLVPPFLQKYFVAGLTDSAVIE